MGDVARARKLTDAQIAVLAAVERRGRPVSLLELRQDFPGIGQSALARRLQGLVDRGLLECGGDAWLIYAGHVRWWLPGTGPYVRAVAELERLLQRAVLFKVAAPVGTPIVTVEVPLRDLACDLLEAGGGDVGEPSELERLRRVLSGLLNEGFDFRLGFEFSTCPEFRGPAGDALVILVEPKDVDEPVPEAVWAIA